MSCNYRYGARCGGRTSSLSQLLRRLSGPSIAARLSRGQAQAAAPASVSSTTAKRSAMASHFITAITAIIARAMVATSRGRRAAAGGIRRNSLSISLPILRVCRAVRAICSGGAAAVIRSATTGRGGPSARMTGL